MLGSALCIPALSVFAAPLGLALSPTLAALVVYALVPSLLINVYIVGLNQLYDIKIDRINKPYLPLVTGELSVGAGTAIVCSSLILGLLLGSAYPPLCSAALRATLWGSALLGTVYSLPPLRLKRFPLLASLCIMSVRGALINWGFFTHASTVLNAVGAAACATSRWRVIGPVAFFTLFGSVIALVKDVPDVAGDRKYGVRSLSVRVGQERVLRLAVRLLALTLSGAAAALAVAATFACQANAWLACARRSAVALLGFVAAACVMRKSRAVSATDGKEVYAYYMWLWKIFYASYICLPFAR